VIPYLKTKPTA